MAYSVGAVQGGMVLDLSKWSGSISQVKKDLGDTGKAGTKTGESLEKAMNRGRIALAGLGALAISSTIEFGKLLGEIQTLGVGEQRILELKKGVQDLGIATGKSTTDISKGVYQVISAFGDTADTMRLVEISAKAATAGVASTEQAINLISAMTKGYGNTSAEAAQKAADLAFQIVKLGQTTFPELAGSMGKVIPMAAAMNVSQEELSAGFSALTGVTGNAAEVATQFRAILTVMAKPTEAMTAALKASGMASVEDSIAKRGLIGTITTLTAATDGSASATTQMFRSAEAATAVMALQGGAAQKFEADLKSMTSATGSADGAFTALTTGINKTGFQMEQLKIKGQVFLQDVGGKMAPVIDIAMTAVSGLADKAASLLDIFGKLPAGVQSFTVAIMGGLAAGGKFGAVLAAAAMGASSLVDSLKTLSKYVSDDEKAAVRQSQDRINERKAMREDWLAYLGTLNRLEYQEAMAHQQALRAEGEKDAVMMLDAKTSQHRLSVHADMFMYRQLAMLHSGYAETRKAKEQKLQDDIMQLKVDAETSQIIMDEYAAERQAVVDVAKEERFLLDQDRLNILRGHNKSVLDAMVADTMSSLAQMGASETAHSDQMETLSAARAAADKTRDDERKARNAQLITAIFTSTAQMIGQLGQLAAASHQRKMTELDEDYKKRQEWIKANVTDETEREKMLSDLEKEHEKKKMEMRKQAAVAEKRTALFSAMVNTASAIVNALQMKPFFPMGLIAAATAGAMGAMQIAAISSKPVPMAEGGVIMPSPGGTLIQAAEAGRPEAIVPLDKIGDVMRDVGGGGSQAQIINNFHIHSMDAAGVERVVIDKIAPALTRLWRSEQFLIPANAIARA